MDITRIREDEKAIGRHLSTAIAQIEAAGKAAGQQIASSYRASAHREFDECQALLDKIKEEAGLD